MRHGGREEGVAVDDVFLDHPGLVVVSGVEEGLDVVPEGCEVGVEGFGVGEEGEEGGVGVGHLWWVVG